MALGLIEGHEHGRVSRDVKPRRDEPPEVQYVLHNPKRRHPQRTVTDALFINPPEDLPHLDAVMSHPFLNASGDRLVTAEGCHPEERVYLQNKHPFAPVSIRPSRTWTTCSATSPSPIRRPTGPTSTRPSSRDLPPVLLHGPMFRFDKPKFGAGATLPVGLVSLLTAGKAPGRVTYCHGEMVEFEKRVAATCRDGTSAVLLDNPPAP